MRCSSTSPASATVYARSRTTRRLPCSARRRAYRGPLHGAPLRGRRTRRDGAPGRGAGGVELSGVRRRRRTCGKDMPGRRRDRLSPCRARRPSLAGRRRSARRAGSQGEALQHAHHATHRHRLTARTGSRPRRRRWSNGSCSIRTARSRRWPPARRRRTWTPCCARRFSAEGIRDRYDNVTGYMLGIYGRTPRSSDFSHTFRACQRLAAAGGHGVPHVHLRRRDRDQRHGAGHRRRRRMPHPFTEAPAGQSRPGRARRASPASQMPSAAP